MVEVVVVAEGVVDVEAVAVVVAVHEVDSIEEDLAVVTSLVPALLLLLPIKSSSLTNKENILFVRFSVC